MKINASPTGPAIRAMVMPLPSAMPPSAWKMPHTVPNRPMKGAVAPVDANRHLAVLQLRQAGVQGVAQAARELRGERRLRFEGALGRLQQRGVEQRQQHGFAIGRDEARAAFGDAGREPEGGDAARDVGGGAAQQPALPEDDHPAADGHREQQQPTLRLMKSL